MSSEKKWTLDAIIEECRKYKWVIEGEGIRTNTVPQKCPRGVLPGAEDPTPAPLHYADHEDPRTADLVFAAADNHDIRWAGKVERWAMHDPPITDSEIQAVRKRLIDELGAREVE